MSEFDDQAFALYVEKEMVSARFLSVDFMWTHLGRQKVQKQQSACSVEVLFRHGPCDSSSGS